MTLTHILVFTAFALLLRWIIPLRWRGWVLLGSSLLAVYWLQPSTPIRNLDFWFPTASIALTVLVWAITCSRRALEYRASLTSALVIAGMVLAIGLTRYIEPLCCLTPTRPPEILPIGLALLLTAALAALFSFLSPLRRYLPSAAILAIITLFVILKSQPLAQSTSAGLRALGGQSPDLASFLDLRWLGFSYLAFRLLHVLRDYQSGRLPAYTLNDFVTYALFFPAYTAGPIDRSQRFIGELKSEPAESEGAKGPATPPAHPESQRHTGAHSRAPLQGMELSAAHEGVGAQGLEPLREMDPNAGLLDGVNGSGGARRRALPQERDPDALFWSGQRILLGVFKKFVLADSLALFALSDLSAAQTSSSLWTWVLLYAYTLRIYFDFSGYTDIALGLGRLAGLSLPENFLAPYLKTNLTAFWNSWHITLAQWFRAYFFNPFTRFLRSGRAKAPAWSVILAGQLLTMLLIGLWHGITWNFAAWGLWHGVGLFVHNRWSEWNRAHPPRWVDNPLLCRGLAAGGWLLTFNYVTLGWVWFALPNLGSALTVFQRLFGI